MKNKEKKNIVHMNFIYSLLFLLKAITINPVNNYIRLWIPVLFRGFVMLIGNAK